MQGGICLGVAEYLTLGQLSGVILQEGGLLARLSSVFHPRVLYGAALTLSFPARVAAGERISWTSTLTYFSRKDLNLRP